MSSLAHLGNASRAFVASGLAALGWGSSQSRADGNQSKDFGLVGLWLDTTSIALLEKSFPEMKGAKAVLLQSPDLPGIDVFEPLYGAEAKATVNSSVSGPRVEALLVDVSLPMGRVDSVGIPSALISSSHEAVALVARLEKLGALGSKLPAWCKMAAPESPPTQGKPEKELLVFKHIGNSGQPLELSGIICPSGLYEKGKHTCSWEPENASASAPAECPLCAFIKGGGCAEVFSPFQACIADVSDAEDAANEAGVEPPPPRSCMDLFAPVAACMASTEEKRSYYKKFIEDFPHLFPCQK